MAFRQAQEKKIEARALTDPRPRFVSLVQAGANQTPIRSIKMDVINMENETMSKKVTALKAEGHEIVSMSFKTGEHFADEAAVRAFLSEGGYDATTLKAVDGGFTVTNEQDEFTDDTREVEVNGGLAVKIGKLAKEEGAEADPDVEAKARANKAGSAITNVEVVEKKEGDEAEGEGAEAKKDDNEGQLAHGLDGSLKPIRKRAKPADEGDAGSATTEGEDAQKDGDDHREDASKQTKDEDAKKDCGCDGEGAQKQGEADCKPDEVFQDGKCVKTSAKVGDETFAFLTEPVELLPGMQVQPGAFEVTDKVEVISGDCGPGFTMLSAGGRSFCVPTGDRSVPAHPDEPTPQNPASGQDSAGFGGQTPAAGQTQRSEGDAGSVLKAGEFDVKSIKTSELAAKFDEFAAHFSDGMSLGEVMDEANDGFPPGLEMVILAAVIAMRNNILAGDTDAVRQVGTDLGEVAAMLASMFEVIERSEDRKKVIDLASGQFTTEWPVAKAKGDNDGADAEQNTAKDDGPLVDALTQLTTTMKSIADGLSEVKQGQEAQADTLGGLSERLQKVEGRKQTRKGADDGDAASGNSEAKVSPIAGLRLRGALGISQTAERSDKYGT